MPLFKIHKNKVEKLFVKFAKERSIQNLIEENLEAIFNIDLLASEFITTWGGRTDTLGIDKNGAPVVIEYKKSQNDNETVRKL